MSRNLEDVFRYEEGAPTPPPAAPESPALATPPSPKLPKVKPPKPAPPPPLPPGPHGFHPSTLARLLHAWQDSGTKEQLLAHFTNPNAKDQLPRTGAAEEIEHTGLKDWLNARSGKISREDVSNFLKERARKLDEYRHTEQPSKWIVTSDGGGSDEYDTQEEAEAAADDLNNDERSELEQDFSIEEEPIPSMFSVDRDRAESLVQSAVLPEVEKESLTDWSYKQNEDSSWLPVPPEGSPHANRKINSFESRNEAIKAVQKTLLTMKARSIVRELGNLEDEDGQAVTDHIKKWAEEHAPFLTDADIEEILHEEGEGSRWVIRTPRYHRSRGDFDEAYDSEEEAKQAVSDWLDENHQPSWQAYEDNDGEVEGSPYEEYVPGYDEDAPRRDYDESWVTMPEAFHKLQPEDIKVKAVPYRKGWQVMSTGDGKYAIVNPRDKSVVRKFNDYNEAVVRAQGGYAFTGSDGKTRYTTYRPGSEMDGVQGIEKMPEPEGGFGLFDLHAYALGQPIGHSDGPITADKLRSEAEDLVKRNIGRRVEPSWRDGHDSYDKIKNPIVRIRHDIRPLLAQDGTPLGEAFFINEMQGPHTSQQEKMPAWLTDRIYDTGLKKAIQLAVKSGQPWIAMTSGDQQNNLYNLRQHVDRLEATPHVRADSTGDKVFNPKTGEFEFEIPPGTPTVWKIKGYKDGNPIRLTHSGDFDKAVKDEDLVSNVGKEVADRLRTHGFADGEGLRGTGAGLRALYDQDLPRRLAKLLKRAGVKPQKVMLPMSEPQVRVRWPNGREEVMTEKRAAGHVNDWGISEPSRPKIVERVAPANLEEVLAIPITDEVRKIAAEGFNFYSRRGSPRRYDRMGGLIDLLRRLPDRQASVMALGLLRLIDIRPEARLEYSPQDLALLQSLAQKAIGYSRAPDDIFRYGLAEDIATARRHVDRNPSEAQKKAGNYKMGHIWWNGLPITIETPKGAVRRGKAKGGKEWSVVMRDDYGYIKRTLSKADGDHVDVFLCLDGEPESDLVYCVNQCRADGKFDEHKFILGCTSKEQAKKVYLRNYSAGWKCGTIVALTFAQFRRWLQDADTSEEICPEKYD